MTQYNVTGNNNKTSIAYTIMTVLIALSFIYSAIASEGYIADGLMFGALITFGFIMQVYSNREAKILVDDKKIAMYKNNSATKPKLEIYFHEVKLLRANADRILVSDGLSKLIKIPFVSGRDYEYLSIYNILREKARVVKADVKSDFDSNERKTVHLDTRLKGYYGFLAAVSIYIVSTFIYTALFIEVPEVANSITLLVMFLASLSYWVYLFYNLRANRIKSSLIIRRSWIALYVHVLALLAYNIANVDGHDSRSLVFWAVMLIFPIFYRMFIVNYEPIVKNKDKQGTRVD